MNRKTAWVNGAEYASLKAAVEGASCLLGRKVSYVCLTQKLRYRETVDLGGAVISLHKPKDKRLQGSLISVYNIRRVPDIFWQLPLSWRNR
jgi:hypothetical protein